MHSLYFVIVEKTAYNNNNPIIACAQAETILENEGFFSQGFFGAGLAERGGAGGRRSGCLQRLFTNTRDHDDRDTSNDINAMIITDELRLKLSETRPDVMVFDSISHTEFEVRTMTSEDNGNWIVAIDYYS